MRRSTPPSSLPCPPVTDVRRDTSQTCASIPNSTGGGGEWGEKQTRTRDWSSTLHNGYQTRNALRTGTLPPTCLDHRHATATATVPTMRSMSPPVSCSLLPGTQHSFFLELPGREQIPGNTYVCCKVILIQTDPHQPVTTRGTQGHGYCRYRR